MKRVCKIIKVMKDGRRLNTLVSYDISDIEEFRKNILKSDSDISRVLLIYEESA